MVLPEHCAAHPDLKQRFGRDAGTEVWAASPTSRTCLAREWDAAHPRE